ncbi:hypothetical protein OROHE_009372 [Orobanche hederae]
MHVFLLCLLAGTSICWFNTVCFVLFIKNFPSTAPLDLSLTVSFNGVSATLYNLAATSLNPHSSAIYLLLNALIPFFTSTVALISILLQPPDEPQPSDLIKRDQLTFLKLNLLAIATGLYLLLLHPSCPSTACLLFSGAVFLLILPLAVPGVIYARDWFVRTACYSSFHLNGSRFVLVHADDLEVHKELLGRPDRVAGGVMDSNDLVGKDRLVVLGQEHNAGMLARRLDFWLYYGAYFCGGTIALAYSNNIGQIAQSLGHSLMNSKLITIYSSFSFFDRLLSAAPDFVRT